MSNMSMPTGNPNSNGEGLMFFFFFVPVLYPWQRKHELYDGNPSEQRAQLQTVFKK